MDTAARDARFRDADAFLRTDQSAFGSAWRYELVRGRIVAHAAPSPEHGVILNNLSTEINIRLRGHAECRPETGSGAAPHYAQRDTARIPDAMIRCGGLPRVLFEVISPSELLHKRQWDQKRADLQAVEGVEEISSRSSRMRCWFTPTGGKALSGRSSRLRARRPRWRCPASVSRSRWPRCMSGLRRRGFEGGDGAADCVEDLR